MTAQSGHVAGAEGQAPAAAAGDEPAAGPEGTGAERPGPEEVAGPESPARLRPRDWWAALRRTTKEFSDDGLTDWAAALTYYGILSIFPGLLVLVSLLGVFGEQTTTTLIDNVAQLAPGAAGEIITNAADSIRANQRTAGLVAIVGLVAAFWSASGYIGAFMRASNRIYDVPEGRPIWKTLPIRVGVTAVTGLLLIASSLIVVFTGRIAEWVGELIGLGEVAVTVWNIAKWPVLVLLVSLLFAILYWASPNARHGGFRWVTPGSLLAVLLWILASAGFAVYVGNFGSYNRTYGALAGAIIFLVWLWISNIAVLLGAELDAELQRGRWILAGNPPEAEPYLELRDTRKLAADEVPGTGT